MLYLFVDFQTGVFRHICTSACDECSSCGLCFAENSVVISYEGPLVADANNRIGFLRDLNGLEPMFHPLKLSMPDHRKASLYIEIRDTYHELYRTEAETRRANPALSEMLNRLYDCFTELFGKLNDRKNRELVRMDAGGMEIL